MKSGGWTNGKSPKKQRDLSPRGKFSDGFKGAPVSDADLDLFVAASMAAKLRRTQRAGEISGALKNALKVGDSFVVNAAGRDMAVCDAHLAVGSLHLAIDGKIFEGITDWFPGRPLLALKHNGHQTVFQIARHAGFYRLTQGGRELDVSVRSPHAAKLTPGSADSPRRRAPALARCRRPGQPQSSGRGTRGTGCRRAARCHW